MDYVKSLTERLGKNQSQEEDDIRKKLSLAREKYTQEGIEEEKNRAERLQSKTSSGTITTASSPVNNSAYNSMSYEEKKDYLKDEKDDALKEKLSAAASKIASLFSSDDEKKELANSRYEKAKTEHEKYKDALDLLKQNKWEETQKDNTALLDSNSEVNNLVKLIYDTEKQNQKVQSQSSATFSNNPLMMITSSESMDSQQKQVIANNKVITDAENKLKEMGYDSYSLLDTYTRNINTEQAQVIDKQVEEVADDKPILANAVSVGLNSMQATALPDMIVNTIQELQTGDYRPLDTNSLAFAPTRAMNTIRETTSENIRNDYNSEFGKNTADFLYQTGMSMADSVSTMPLTVVPGARSAVIGASAMTQGVVDSADRGVSSTDALLTGLAQGTSEVVFEALSLGNLKALKSSGKTGVKNFVKDVLKQSFVEGSEETATEISNIITDKIINDDKSSIDQTYNSYIETGYSEEEARKQTAKDTALQVLQAFAGGAVSGGVFGAGASTINSVNMNNAYKAQGNAIKSADQVSQLVNKGLEQDVSSPAYKIAMQMLTKDEVADTYTTPTNENVSSKKLGQLNQEIVKENDISAFSTLVKGEKDAQTLTESFAKLINGENLSRKEINTLMTNEASRKALSQLTNIDAISNEKMSNSKLAENLAADYRNTSMLKLDYLQRPTEYATTKSGETVILDGIEENKYGNITVKTLDNQVLNLDEINVQNDDTKQLLDFAGTLDDKTSKAFVEGYNYHKYNGTVNDYFAGTKEIIKAQVQGKSFEEAYSTANKVSSITKEQAEHIYFNSVLDQVVKNTVREKNKTNIINQKKRAEFDNVINSKAKPGATVLAENLNEFNKSEIKTIELIAKKYGREVIIVDDTEELGYASSNGFYENGKIVLAANNEAGIMSAYFGHELFHDLKKNSPKQAQELQDFVISTLKEQTSYNYEQRFESLKELYKDEIDGLSDKETTDFINEEITANACFTVFTNENNVNRLVKENKTLAEKIRDFFANFCKTIENALVKLSKSNKEYKALEGQDKITHKILEMFDAALNAEQQNNSNNGTDLKYSKNIEEFDERGYNIINTTGKKEYSNIKSEIMTWDADRHLNEIRCGYLGGGFIIYKMLDTDSRDIILYKPKSAFAKNEYAKIRRQYNDNGRKFARPDNVVEVIRNKRNSSNDNNSLFGQKSEKYRGNDKLNNSSVREKGYSDGRRTAQNDHNDNLSKRRYSLNEKSNSDLETAYFTFAENDDEAFNTEQKIHNNTVRKSVNYSKKLGRFADVNIYSQDELNFYGVSDTVNSLNDFVKIQKDVINKLKSIDFFNVNNRNIVVNADTGIVVEISPDGIRETLSKDNRYETLPRKIKVAKIATVRSLPNLIKYAEVVELHQPDYHNKKNVEFLVLQHPATVDNENYEIEIKIKHSLEKNKFYIHNLTLKNEMSGAFGKGVNNVNKSMPLISGAQSRGINLSQESENVNNTNVKEKLSYSKKEKIDAKKALTNEELKSVNSSRSKMEINNDYEYGNRDFILVNTSTDENSQKLVCYEANIDGELEPYSIYLFENSDYNIHEDTTLIDTIIELERNDKSNDTIRKSVRAIQKFGNQSYCRLFNRKSGRYSQFGRSRRELIRNSISATGSGKNNGRTSATNSRDDKTRTNLDQTVKFSLKQDSEGNELSDQQQEFFKDSKVRDEDGNSLVVYHGTEENFTVFDSTKSRSNMDVQGNFFSSWKIDAKKALTNEELKSVNSSRMKMEINNDYEYGNRDFILVDTSTDENSQKLVCYEANIDGELEPYSIYLFKNSDYNIHEDTTLIDTIIDLESEDYSDDSIRKSVQIIQQFGNQPYCRKYSAQSHRYTKYGRTKREIAKYNLSASRSRQNNRQTSATNSREDKTRTNLDQTVKFSLKQDSEGNGLSDQQQEFFKDSKVRDEDGNLLVVYHGTEENFTVFDSTKSRTNMDVQGNFFSSWKIDAQGYGSKVDAYYLNIKNPAPEGVAYKALNKFKGQNYAGVKAREYLEKMGYDGVNNENEEYIAFYPEQIKLVDNTTPTDNVDVRYSKKSTGYSFENLISKPDMTITTIDDGVDYNSDKSSRKSIVDNALKSALSVGHKDTLGNTYVYVNDIDTNILLSKRGLRHSLDRRLNIIAPVTENIGPVLKNSIRINELVPEFDTIEKSYVLIGIAKNSKNEPYVVSFVVNKASNEIMSIDVLYAVNAKKEAAALIEPELSSKNDVSLTASSISVSNLLDYVNKYYPKILSEDVLRHYGYSSRSDGVIDNSALYSRKENNTNYKDLLRNNEELTEINENLQRMLELVSSENNELREQFKIKTVRNQKESSVNKVSAYLRKQYESNYNKSALTSRLASLYDYITNAGENVDSDYIWNVSKDIATDLLSDTHIKDTTVYDENKELRDYIRKTTIQVPENVRNDIPEYNDFRKRNFGTMRLSNDKGTPLDTIYNELSNINPAYFPADAVLSEQLENIENFFNSTEPVYYNGAEMITEDNGLSLDEYSNIVASDIFEQYFNVPEVQSFVSEKNQEEMEMLHQEYKAQLEDVRKLYRERYEEQLRLLREENQQRLEKLKDKNDKTIAKLNERHLDQIAKQKAHFKDVSKRGTQRRNASKLRESIRRSLKKIAKLGASPNKKNHIPNSIIDSVKSLADVINLDSTKKDELISTKLNQIRTSFDRVKKNSEYTEMSEAYNDFIENEIIELQEKTEGKTLKQLTNNDLESIDKILKATVKAISNINKLFNKDRTNTVNNYAYNVKQELSSFGKEKINDGLLRSFAYNSMKPEYFFEYLGSDTFLELYNDLRKGEDVWVTDVNEAKRKSDGLRNKYGWNNWDDEAITFSTISGDVELNLQERLAIYANSLGEHTKNHLLGGGFKYQAKKPRGFEKLKKQKNDNQAHRLSEEDITTIVSTLTDEQTSYVKDMIEYMSTVMARKGNEVSKELYDIELFKEATYYPAKVDRESIVVSSKEVRPEKQIKNAGFTNAAVVNAKQPIILMNFDDVWATHIGEMSKYHAFVLPLDNFDRVFNSYQVNDDRYESVKEYIKNSFGVKAVNYIDDLIRDINGGVVQEAGVDVISKLTGLFKKNAVFASMSVVVQQPSAIGRALSEIDTKYLAKATGKGFNRNLYEEMKNYAPVAQIKEMGYFDTNMAQSTVEYLNSKSYETLKEKAAAFVKDGSFRDDVLSYFASKADEITWTQIWQAVKYETDNKYSGISKEEKLKISGERFTDIIVKTQVYDSVFSRSGLMRSRDSAVKNAMAFMAEPTTSLNMLTNAIIQTKRGKMSKVQGAKVLGSLVAASVLNSLLQSIVTSARDIEPEDDEEWMEIYLSHLLPNFIENINPLNQIAFVKDIVNIFKGYDIERADMNLFSDFADAINKLDSEKATITDKITGLAGAISAFFGFPLKNIIRDVKAAFNTGQSILNGFELNSTESYEIYEEEMNQVFGFELFKPDYDKAVKAIKKGDYNKYEKYAETVYASSQAYNLLYEVLKKYGYNSSEYSKAEELCVEVKKENGTENPNPINSIKNKCIKEYSELKENGTYAQAEEARQRCIQVYGSADDVSKALEKYEKSNTD